MKRSDLGQIPHQPGTKFNLPGATWDKKKKIKKKEKEKLTTISLFFIHYKKYFICHDRAGTLI